MKSVFLEVKPPDWHKEAQCNGTSNEIFFVDSPDGDKTNEWAERTSIAKSICKACTVRLECLEYAIDTRQEKGIWGGLTPRERRRVQHKGA